MLAVLALSHAALPPAKLPVTMPSKPYELETYEPMASNASIVVAGNARFTVLTERLVRMEYDPASQCVIFASLLMRCGRRATDHAPPIPRAFVSLYRPALRTARRWRFSTARRRKLRLPRRSTARLSRSPLRR